MSGAGGVGLALAYVASEDRIRALNFSGRMPAAADPEEYAEEDKDVGIKSALVPGNVAGWLTLHETYGKLERERLFRARHRLCAGRDGYHSIQRRFYSQLGISPVQISVGGHIRKEWQDTPTRERG